MRRAFRVAPQHLAHADVDGHRAGAAVPAGARRDPRRAAAAAQPQRGQGRQYIAEHPTIGPWLDRLQAFDVFSSFWFTAIYVLLFISLVGCLTPRLVEHVRSLRATPVAAPRNLARLPKHHSARGRRANRTRSPPTVSERLTRLAAHQPRPNGDAIEISAEKGYLREFGNIVFHFSLLGLLVAVAVGQAVRLRGQRHRHRRRRPRASARPRPPRSTRSARATPSTALAEPDLLAGQRLRRALPAERAGAVVRRQHRLPGRRRPRHATPGGPTASKVNHPLRIGGDRVYLQGHGYAPTFTVTFPDGQTRTQTVQWRPDEPLTLLSSGVMRVDPPGRHLSRRRRAAQAPDRDPGPVRADRAAATARCCRRASPRSTIPRSPSTSTAATPDWTPGDRSRCSRSTRG